MPLPAWRPPGTTLTYRPTVQPIGSPLNAQALARQERMLDIAKFLRDFKPGGGGGGGGDNFQSGGGVGDEYGPHPYYSGRWAQRARNGIPPPQGTPPPNPAPIPGPAPGTKDRAERFSLPIPMGPMAMFPRVNWRRGAFL